MGLYKFKFFIVEFVCVRFLWFGNGGEVMCFKKGLVFFNKGMCWFGYVLGNMVVIQFKKGSKFVIWVFVGSFRIVEGILEQKYVDDLGLFKV